MGGPMNQMRPGMPPMGGNMGGPMNQMNNMNMPRPPGPVGPPSRPLFPAAAQVNIHFYFLSRWFLMVLYLVSKV